MGNPKQIQMILKFQKTILVIIVMVVVTLSSPQHIHAKSQSASEYEVKAAFIYNFLKFIECSTNNNSSDTITLYVLGKNPFGNAIKKTLNIPIKNKKCKIKYIKSIKSIQKLESCYVIFISSSEKKYLSQILELLVKFNVLTIGDTRGFAQQGVIINFYIEQNKVCFEINVDAAKRAGLRISSKLLRLAKIVHDTPKRRG